MNSFTFDVYYEYSRDNSKPMTQPKSRAEVEAALGYFRNDVMRGLADMTASLEVKKSSDHPNGQRVTIVTRQSEEVVMKVVQVCLGQQELFAKPL